MCVNCGINAHQNSRQRVQKAASDDFAADLQPIASTVYN